MPDIATYRRMLSAKGTKINEVVKNHSDKVMEYTWDRDIQSKICYIYDYFHDDQKHLCKGMTFENTTKTMIDAKFIVTTYPTISKDQVEYHIMFRPSQPVSFSQEDELFYYETDFAKKYGAEFPIGMYIDIPDEKQVYHKWLICAAENGNQFIKYSVLPCNYNLQWVEQNGHERIKRSMWSVIRMQNSYNSGLWLDYVFESVENQDKVWLPMNSISEKIFYTHINGDKTNQRMIVSAPIQQPITWQISKVENIHPLGLQKITLAQDRFDPNRDYVNLETGEMYADYYSTNTTVLEEEFMNPPIAAVTGEILCNSNTIKVGGSYKTFTVKIRDNEDNDLTANYGINMSDWYCYLDDEDITQSDLIALKEQAEDNKMKIKFLGDSSYLTKTLIVKCDLGSVEASIEMEIVSV